MKLLCIGVVAKRKMQVVHTWKSVRLGNLRVCVIIIVPICKDKVHNIDNTPEPHTLLVCPKKEVYFGGILNKRRQVHLVWKFSIFLVPIYTFRHAITILTFTRVVNFFSSFLCVISVKPTMYMECSTLHAQNGDWQDIDEAHWLPAITAKNWEHWQRKTSTHKKGIITNKTKIASPRAKLETVALLIKFFFFQDEYCTRGFHIQGHI